MKRILSVFIAVVFAAGIALPAWAGVKLVAKFSKTHCQHPKFSPSGQFLAFEVLDTRKRSIQLRILNLKTGKTKVVTSDALRSTGLSIQVPGGQRGMVSRELAWAPKGNRYLFASNGRGSVYHIYLAREGRLKVSSKSKNDGQPAWSNDGKFVVFTSGRSGKGDLYYYNTGKLKVKRLTKYNSSTEFFPVWSPKRSLQLAFVRHTEQSDRIYIINNVFARRSKRLTKWKKAVSELNPSWSPDGKHIAFFTVNAKQTYHAYVTDLKGKVKRLAKNVVKSDQYGPAWSPDGKHVFVVRKVSGNKDKIFAVNVTTGKSRVIKTNTMLNNELSVAKKANGSLLLAFTAQGQKGSTQQTFRKLFTVTIKASELP